MVHIKGGDNRWAPAPTGVADGIDRIGRAESNLGRSPAGRSPPSTGLLERAIDGHGAVSSAWSGPPGIGKSRLVARDCRDCQPLAVSRCSRAFCESHASDIPFHVVARLLRAVTGSTISTTRLLGRRCVPRFADADPEDVLLLDDLLGIRDPDMALPDIDPDARRRRLTALVNSGVAGPRDDRRSTSSRTRIGSTRSASRCWPTSWP